ncbi:MAG: PIN domain-containing protein [Desulfamplus sp.]|nr:PIN domain-containing protein [Desulfamplus sp.]
MSIKFRTVPDTNIILASTSENPKSPNREYYERWLYGEEFDLLYSDDTLAEYALKLKTGHFNVPDEKIEELISHILILGVNVDIDFFHLRVYPKDPDDVAFVLCAQNGNATHLISYDKHILDLQYHHDFDFKICQVIGFLQDLRESRNAMDWAST